jgi:hypothetical protein
MNRDWFAPSPAKGFGLSAMFVKIQTTPHSGNQIVLADHTFTVGDQIRQQIEDLRLDCQQLGGASQLPALGVLGVVFEDVDHSRASATLRGIQAKKAGKWQELCEPIEKPIQATACTLVERRANRGTPRPRWLRVGGPPADSLSLPRWGNRNWETSNA